MIRRNLSLFLIVLCSCACFSFAAIRITNTNIFSTAFGEDVPILEAVGPEYSIQVALLLDTSGSMHGLIEQAKSQLWNILNELARTQKGNMETDLQIALYEYGNPAKANSEFQIHQLSDFTNDMDLISEKLFSLTTSGGEEYCGAVIKRSLNQLDWKNGEGLRVIYIAGNEPFDQGPISFSKACKKAKSKGIMINTIFCGEQSEGVQGRWNEGASLGGGDFLSISHNEATVYISTPYDDEISALNDRLNDTYIPFGAQGSRKKANQFEQDKNASKYSMANAADRYTYKSSKKYKADDWDLVDAYKKDKAILKTADIKMKKYKEMTIAELESNIEKVIHQREAIQSEIRALDIKRRAFKEEAAQEKQGAKEKSLQESIIKTVHKQAKSKGLTIQD